MRSKAEILALPLIFSALALLAAPAAAWDRTGHLVVARIAWERLSPEARSAAAELLASAPADAGLSQLMPRNGRPLTERQAELFQNAAYWPDIVRDDDFPDRQQKYHRGNWHWINIFFEQRGPERTAHELDLEPQGRIVERLGALAPTLGDTTLAAAERAVHLAWVLHLAGDVHQPLHATARVTRTEPEGDRGGNLFQLAGGDNLHSLWDGILRRSYFRWFFESDDRYVRRIARAIVAEHPPDAFGTQIDNRDYAAWARSSFEIARDTVYPADLERHRRPPSGYLNRARDVAEARVALAGYRLAALLEGQLGGSKTAVDGGASAL